MAGKRDTAQENESQRCRQLSEGGRESRSAGLGQRPSPDRREVRACWRYAGRLHRTLDHLAPAPRSFKVPVRGRAVATKAARSLGLRQRPWAASLSGERRPGIPAHSILTTLTSRQRSALSAPRFSAPRVSLRCCFASVPLQPLYWPRSRRLKVCLRYGSPGQAARRRSWGARRRQAV